MITMNDIFISKTPEKILKILKLMDIKNVEFDHIFNMCFENVKHNYRYLDVENQLKMAEDDVRSILNYLENKLNIVLGHRGYLIDKDLDFPIKWWFYLKI